MNNQNGLRAARLAREILQLVILSATVATLAATAAVRLMGLERSTDHDADIVRIERKLDCALWDLPQGCRATLSPRD